MLTQINLLQLDDAFGAAVAPEAGSLEALRARLLATQSAMTAKETAERVNEALTFAVGDLVQADIPQSLIQEIGQNEYQAQLFRLQAQARYVAADVLLHSGF